MSGAMSNVIVYGLVGCIAAFTWAKMRDAADRWHK